MNNYVKNFSLESLFGKPIRGTRLIKDKRTKGNIPLVTAGYNNYGIAELINNKEQQTFKSGFTIDMFGNCFYRDYEFKADDNILVFDNPDLTKEVKLFIATCINKSTVGYSYGSQFRLNSYNNTLISLPIKLILAPDFEIVRKFGGGGYQQ